MNFTEKCRRKPSRNKHEGGEPHANELGVCLFAASLFHLRPGNVDLCFRNYDKINIVFAAIHKTNRREQEEEEQHKKNIREIPT